MKNEMIISLTAHMLIENMRYNKKCRDVNKYKAMKRMLKALEENSRDENILKIYGDVYLNYCLSCGFLKDPNPWRCVESCELYQVKRECFERISDGKLIRDFLEKLEDELKYTH